MIQLIPNIDCFIQLLRNTISRNTLNLSYSLDKANQVIRRYIEESTLAILLSTSFTLLKGFIQGLKYFLCYRALERPFCINYYYIHILIITWTLVYKALLLLSNPTSEALIWFCSFFHFHVVHRYHSFHSTIKFQISFSFVSYLISFSIFIVLNKLII